MAYEITQTLVDITNQDSNDISQWVSENPDKIVPQKVREGRLRRFKTAFWKIFNNTLKYKGLNNVTPVFDKNGKEISIDNLSSGEKQIIFRGIYLLKNKYSLLGAIVVIDEPEISMHPKWEKNILEYYKNLFVDEKKLTSQLFIATHSEHVLECALKDENAMIIKMNKSFNNKKYNAKITGGILPKVTLAEIKYSIFDLYTVDFHIILYGHIQNKYSNTQNIKDFDKWLLSEGFKRKHYYETDSRGRAYEYETLPTYVRNCIDHPSDTSSYTQKELKESIDSMVAYIRKHK